MEASNGLQNCEDIMSSAEDGILIDIFDDSVYTDTSSNNDRNTTEVPVNVPEGAIEPQARGYDTNESVPFREDTNGHDLKLPPQNLTPQDKLLWFLEKNRLDEFIELLKDPAVKPRYKYNKPPSNYGTCIEIAARLPNRGKFVKALLEAGAKPNINTIYPEPIHYAAKAGNPDALQVLLRDKRTNINAVDSKGNTALHFAVKYSKPNRQHKYPECIKILLNKPEFDINKPNMNGYTPIHKAAKHLNKEAVCLILNHRNHDVDLDTVRAHGRTARESIMENYPELKLLLPKMKHKDMQGNPETRLLSSLQYRQLDLFNSILRQIDEDGNARIDPNYFYEYPYLATCLEIACKEDGCFQYVEALLGAGAEPNTLNPFSKQSPLHLAAKLGNEAVLEVLLKDRRTNVNILTGDGESVLHVLAQADYNGDMKDRLLKCLELILKTRKKDTNEIAIQDGNCNSAAKLALSIGNIEFLREMLRSANLDTDVIQAIYTKYSDLTREKLHVDIAGKIQPASSTSYITTYLFQLLDNGDITSFVQNVKPNKSDPRLSSEDNGKFTLLQYATSIGNKEAVKALLDAEVNPNTKTVNEKRPPIMIAVMKKNKEILNLFLELGKLDVNAVDGKGNTALHCAAKNEDLESVMTLIEHGADIKHKNIFNKPPLSASSVEIFLNASLKTNESFPESDDYQLIFDYSFLLVHNNRKDLENETHEESENSDDNPSQDERQTLGNNSTEGTENPSQNVDEQNEVENLIVANQPAVSRIPENHDEQNTHLPKEQVPLLNDVEQNEIISKSEILSDEMEFLYYISRSRHHRKLMKHPIITTFLQIKWIHVRLAFLINLGLYSLFMISLNAYIYTSIIVEDNAEGDASFMQKKIKLISQHFTVLFSVFFALREVFQFFVSPKQYLKNPENFIDVFIILCTFRLCWFTWHPFVVVIVILLSWTELVLLTGRLPHLSRNIEMLKTVSKNYCLFLFSYVFIIIAFAFSFFSLLHKEAMAAKDSQKNNSTNQDQHIGFYSNPWLSVFKTFVMMLGEFETSNLFSQLESMETFFWLFSLFVFVVALVLVNLLTGLAVSDTQKIKANAERLSLVSRIKLIYDIEKALLQWLKLLEKCNSCIYLYSFIRLNKKIIRKINLFPENSRKKCIYVSPNKDSSIINLVNVFKLKISLNTLRNAVEIISNNGKDKDLCNLKQIQDEVQENHKDLVDRLQHLEKIEENHKELVDRLQNLDKVEENHKELVDRLQKLEHLLTKSFKV